MKKKVYLILLLTLTVHLTKAQTFPGNVGNGLKLWIKSSQGTTTTADFVDDWEYANNPAFKFSATGSERPSLLPNKINFNPSVNFGGAQFMDGPTGDDAPITAENDEYTVFAVWQSGASAASQSIWTQGKTDNLSGDYFSLFTLDGKYGNAFEVPPTDQTIQREYFPGIWNISQINLFNSGNQDFELIDNRNFSTGSLILGSDPNQEDGDGAGLRTIATELNRLGHSGGPTDVFLDGDIVELIVYDRPLDSEESKQVFSYLAVKYGVTLKTDIFSSLGTAPGDEVWNAGLDGGLFNNNVFGLALDNQFGLEVTKSNSIETGNGDGTGQSGQANIVISNPSNLTTDQTYLLIGNDGGSTSESGTSIDLPLTGTGSSRLEREWKVQLTGDPGTVSLTFDLTDIDVSGHATQDFRLMVTDDPTGDFTSVNARTYKATLYDADADTVRFDNVSLANNEVFGLITFAAGALPVTWKSFTGTPVTGGIALNWTVDNNVEGKTYEIEHSLDGQTFTKTGEILNKKDVQSYSFKYNTAASGIHYFRIRQVDLDEKAYYSKVIKVLIKGNSAYTIRLLNNPVRNNYAEFEIIATKRGQASVELWSYGGAKLASQKAQITQGTNRIKVPMDRAAAGTYLFKLQIDEVLVTEKVMKF